MTFNCGLCKRKLISFYDLLEHLWYKHHFNSRWEKSILRQLLEDADEGQL